MSKFSDFLDNLPKNTFWAMAAIIELTTVLFLVLLALTIVST